MKLLIIPLITFLVILAPVQASKKRSRSTTTTEIPVVEELTLADREANLLDRELNLRRQEAVFRNREEQLSIREAQFKDREDKLSKRENNIENREQNTLRGSCSSSPNGEAATPPDFSEVRWDRDSGKLLDIGDLATCSENMRFFASPDNETEGVCDCDFHNANSCSRPLVYSDKYKQCFWAWSQGPCEQKEWYVFDENLATLVCEPNPCPETLAVGTPSYYFKFAEDGKCYKAGSKGPCKKKGERLFTIPDEPIPKCRGQALCPALSIPAMQRCILGNRRFFDGHCTESTVDDAAEVDE